MKLLAENEKIKIVGEYEETFFINKKSKSKILIGDFYGDPQVAIIDKKEKFCAIGGCRLIIYYLSNPYESYSYEKQTLQWKEMFRDGKEVWVEDIKQVDDSTIEIEFNEMKNSLLINVITGKILQE